MKLGQKLKKSRNKVNLTQNDVADHLHVSRKTVSGWENDRSVPDIYTIKQLSELYNTDLIAVLDHPKAKERSNNKGRQINYALIAWYFNLVAMGLNLFNLFTGFIDFSFFVEIIAIILFFSIHVYYFNNKVTIRNKMPFSWLFLLVMTALFFTLQIEKLARLGFEIATFTYVGALFRAIVLDYGVLIIFTFKEVRGKN